jgi:hypothetical protein
MLYRPADDTRILERLQDGYDDPDGRQCLQSPRVPPRQAWQDTAFVISFYDRFFSFYLKFILVDGSVYEVVLIEHLEASH